jgi:uncharacterized OB-fold protein
LYNKQKPMTQHSATEDLPPIWPGLWGRNADGPYLCGARCKSCGHVALETRAVCPSCWAAAEAAEEVPIGREGTLYTFTVIHQVPTGFQAPMAVGYVDLAEGVRVFAHLDRSPETLTIGGRVSLSISPLKVDGDGAQKFGPLYHSLPEPRR